MPRTEPPSAPAERAPGASSPSNNSTGSARGSGGRSTAVSVRGVSKVFPDGTHALEPIGIEVAEGEFVSIVGPSGCGKSTLLRIIAGLTPATNGDCLIPDSAQQAFVFQDATLLPWRNVRRNAQLLLELESFEGEERRRRTEEVLRLVGLEGFERAYPRALSGGMKMRLSLARALALRPKLFLMDEPFSAIDEITRESLNDELLRLWLLESFTALFVTHNVYEAVYLSNRVVVMSSRPARILEDFRVPFAFPRRPE
ncbi:MAG: ABC transporter ATP-binding protein, partial [Gaiellaceae bacterium]